MSRKTWKGNCEKNTIVNEELISFKELEKKIYSYVCKLARGITEQISSTCGQGISDGGALNMMQRLGERIDGEELHAVKQMDADQTEGKKVIPVLFEEILF